MIGDRSDERVAGNPDPGGTVRIRLRIRGRVQGVWYRGSARERALELGLRGWAQNRADGSVEIVAEGPLAAVDGLVAWCHEGPVGARVVSVERTAEPAGEEIQGFTVRG